MMQLTLPGIGTNKTDPLKDVSRVADDLIIPEGMYTVDLTHGLHRFPGKFIPTIPHYIFSELLPQSADTRVIDPFCGSGTTLIEATLLGIPSIGIDIDPLSTLIARAKTRPLDELQLQVLENTWRGFTYDGYDTTLIPDVPNLTHWFTDACVAELASIKTRALELDEPLRTFALVVFSSIIRRVSNADDQSQKTYVSHTLSKSPPLPHAIFPVFIAKAIQSMRQFSIQAENLPTSHIITADARSIPAGISFTDVVTSPPYIDSIDYMYNQMLEYFWLLEELGVGNHRTYRRLRKTPMGMRSTADQSITDKDGAGFPWDLSSLLEQVAERSTREAEIILNYFKDFAQHVASIASLIPSGRRYIVVVGSSKIRGLIVPTPEILKEIFEATGFHTIDRLKYSIRRHYMKFPRRSNSGRIDEDHIIVFERD